jgi:hypothetical protein
MTHVPDAAADGLSLRDASLASHARLAPHVDALLAIAERVGSEPCSVLHARLDAELSFADGNLVPHMDLIEATLYGPLESLMGPRHTMVPMREEHAIVRALVAELDRYRAHAAECPWNDGDGVPLRRLLYRLHALLKMHLAEEERYLGVLDRNLPAADRAALAARLHGALVEPG